TAIPPTSRTTSTLSSTSDSGSSKDERAFDSQFGQRPVSAFLGQQRGAGVDAVINLDFSRVNPITGPIAIEGARPGDVLRVEILAIETREWGWTANIPGFGLLADEYPEPFVKVWECDYERNTAQFRPGIQVPLDPFVGVIGVAPAESGQHATIPPRRVGGNMDIRFMRAGSTLYLPVA